MEGSSQSQTASHHPACYFKGRVEPHWRKNSYFNNRSNRPVPEFYLFYFICVFPSFSFIFLPFCFSSLLWPSSALPTTHNAILCSVSLSPMLELLCIQKQPNYLQKFKERKKIQVFLFCHFCFSPKNTEIPRFPVSNWFRLFDSQHYKKISHFSIYIWFEVIQISHQICKINSESSLVFVSS